MTPGARSDGRGGVRLAGSLSGRLLCAAVLTALWACAAAPRFDSAGVDPGLTPQSPVATADTGIGRAVMWAGVIVSSSNQPKQTQIEVLAHQVQDNGKPDLAGPTLGRFLILSPGYLETLDYAPGRLVTVVGSLGHPREGHIGESSYLYPVVWARQLHLWAQGLGYARPSFYIGIGVHN